MSTDVLVIGGGLAGIACAVGLTDSGLRVTLVERSRALGGRAGSCRDSVTGDVVDVGPHVLLTQYPNLLRLLENLGTRDRIAWDLEQVMTLVDRGIAVGIRGTVLPAPFHLLPSLLRVPTISTRDLLSNHHVSWFVVRAKEEDLLRLDDVDALTFLRRMNTSPRFIEWFWATVSMAIMNVPLERCSAGALLRFYRILLAHRNLHLGCPEVGLAELFEAEAMRRVEGGGGRVILEREVEKLVDDTQGVTAAVMKDGGRIEAEVYVCAVEPAALAQLLPSRLLDRHGPLGGLESFVPSPYISSYIWFDRKLTHARNWARTWSPRNLNYDFYDLSNIRRGWEHRPSVIAGNIIYCHRAAHLDDDEIVRATVAEIAELAPEAAAAKVCHARVHHVPMAIPCPHPGLERKRPPVETPLPNLYLAGDWVDTGLPASMEGAVRAGSLAAERVLAKLGRPRRLALHVTRTRGILSLTARGRAADVDRWTRYGAPMA